MPYSWESRSWLTDDKQQYTRGGATIGRLERHGIPPPQASGLCAVLPDGNGNISQPGLLDTVEPGVRQRLRGMFYQACRESRHRKRTLVFNTMTKINDMIERMNAGRAHLRNMEGIKVCDLQAIWYCLRNVLGVRIASVSPHGAIDTFMREYWCELLPALKPRISQGEKQNQSVLEQLLCCVGIGPVNMEQFIPFTCHSQQSLLRGISECLEDFLRTTMSKISGNTGLELVGSVGEGSKIGYCDEFDYRLEFKHDDIVSLIQQNTRLIHVSKICDEYDPSPRNIHRQFMDIVRSLIKKPLMDKLTLLACDDFHVPVPWLLFSWHPDPADKEMLVKVDCSLTVPCPGVWPGDQQVNPLGQPVEKIAHLMIPNPNGNKLRGHQAWRWSVCTNQTIFCQSLPKYVQLGYMISKMICSHVLFPDTCGPPSTFCLKNCMFSAIASKDITVCDNACTADDMLLQALRVTDRVLAGLDKCHFGYFYHGEPVEHLHSYLQGNTFLAQNILQLLVEDHVKQKEHLEASVDSLIPATLRAIRNDTTGASDISMVRDILGLPRMSEGDSWGKVTREAARKWAHFLPESITWMWKDAEDLAIPRCLTDIETVRQRVAASDQNPAYVDNNAVSAVLMYGLHQSAHDDWVMCQCSFGKLPQYHSLGAAYEACVLSLEDFIRDVTEAMGVGVNDWGQGGIRLQETARKYGINNGNDYLMREIALGHIVDLSQGTPKLWKMAFKRKHARRQHSTQW